MNKRIANSIRISEAGVPDFHGRMNRNIISGFDPSDYRSSFSLLLPPENKTHQSVRYLLKTELYFGLSKSDGSTVSEKEWADFMDIHVIPAFGGGLTVMNGEGRWRMIETDEIIKERMKMMILYHENIKINHENIENIRENYKRRFRQESVLRITAPVWISL
jgi:hypothetical protein